MNVYVSVLEGKHEGKFPLRPEKGVESFAERVTGGFELFHIEHRN